MQNCGSYAFSQNWAAVVGIIICILLLTAWFQYKLDTYSEEEDLIDPGGK